MSVVYSDIPEKDMFRIMVENTIEAIIVIKDEKVIFSNPAWQKLAESSFKDSDKVQFLSMVYSGDVELVSKILQKVLSGESHEITEKFRLITPSGSTRWILAKIRQIEWNGETAGIIYAEEEQSQLNTLLSLFIKNSPIYAFIKEVSPNQCKVLAASENYKDMIGISGSQMAGKTMEELFPPEFASKITADDWEVASNDKVLHVDEDLNGRHYTTIKYPIKLGDKRIIAGYTIDITQQKRAEKAERDQFENLARFSGFADASQYGMGMADLEGYITYVNPTLVKMLGEKSEENCIGKHFPTAYYPGSLAEKLKQEVFPALMRDGQWQGELELINTEGDNIPTFENYFIIKDKAGNPIYIADILTDISERKKIESALQESENRIRTIFETSMAGIILVESNGIISYANNRMGELFKCSMHELIGSRYIDFVFPDEVQTGNQNMIQLINGEIDSVALERHYLCADGSDFWGFLSGRRLYNMPGIPSALVGFITDVTQRKLNDTALQESNLRYQTYFEQAPYGIVTYNPETTGFIEFNDQTCNQLGYTREEFSKLRIFDIEYLETEEDTRNRIKEITETGKTEFETKHITKSGEIRDVFVSVRLLYVSGTPIYHCIYQDIAEIKQKERDLILAKEKAEESDRLKSSFLANMSHEIRTPMNSIMGFSELMIGADPNEKEHYSGIILKSSSHLLSLIDNIIYISRLQSEKLPVVFALFRPAELLNDVYQVINLPDVTRNLELRLKIPENSFTLEIRSDADKIRQILINLVTNGLKYTSQGFVELGFEVTGTQINFYVQDSGAGIQKEEQSKIFESFYRGEFAQTSAIRGTGLGLSISKMLADLLGGQLSVSSEPGHGSCFKFSLPLN